MAVGATDVEALAVLHHEVRRARRGDMRVLQQELGEGAAAVNVIEPLEALGLRVVGIQRLLQQGHHGRYPGNGRQLVECVAAVDALRHVRHRGRRAVEQEALHEHVGMRKAIELIECHPKINEWQVECDRKVTMVAAEKKCHS